MSPILAFPATTESLDITGANISGLAEATDVQRRWFLNDTGVPIAHPNLSCGHVLVCQLDIPDGSKSTWVCNNFDTMRELHSQFTSGQATAIRWYIGHGAAIQAT